MNLERIFEQVLKEMEVNQVRSMAPVKIDGTIDYQFLKTDWNVEKMKEFVSARKNIYCGYALVDVKIDKIVKLFKTQDT